MSVPLILVVDSDAFRFGFQLRSNNYDSSEGVKISENQDATELTKNPTKCHADGKIKLTTRQQRALDLTMKQNQRTF